MIEMIGIIDSDDHYSYRIGFSDRPKIPLEVRQWCRENFNEERCYVGTWTIWFKTSAELNWFILRWS